MDKTPIYEHTKQRRATMETVSENAAHKLSLTSILVLRPALQPTSGDQDKSLAILNTASVTPAPQIELASTLVTRPAAQPAVGQFTTSPPIDTTTTSPRDGESQVANYLPDTPKTPRQVTRNTHPSRPSRKHINPDDVSLLPRTPEESIVPECYEGMNEPDIEPDKDWISQRLKTPKDFKTTKIKLPAPSLTSRQQKQKTRSLKGVKKKTTQTRLKARGRRRGEMAMAELMEEERKLLVATAEDNTEVDFFAS